VSDQLSQLLKDEKFLEKVREFALSHKLDPMSVSWTSLEQYQSFMWTAGVIDALYWKNFKITKGDNE
jgi:hypothetical protein